VKREIKILKFINHQNIIKLYEVLDTTNDIFVIMELADGGELYDYIQNNDISEE
jgi:serine/threonine protein kinase